MTEVPMERYLLNMPYEILFEIFRELPKGKLYEIFRFFPKFGNVAGDTRLWKDVYIKYGSSKKRRRTLDFEKLYSGPFPVRVIDFSHTIIRPGIKPSICFGTDQVVKVTKLNLSSVKANKATMKAMLDKYQCRELHLDLNNLNPSSINGIITLEAFSKQTALEMLSLTGTKMSHLSKWLGPVLSRYCKNLKILDLSFTDLSDLDLALVRSLPTSLEKIYLIDFDGPENSFFELLAEYIPNLKEIGLWYGTITCPALLKFKFLKALTIDLLNDKNIHDIYKYLIKFPALKDVRVYFLLILASETNLEPHQTKLSPHGITINKITSDFVYPKDGNLWQVLKAT